MSGPPFRLGEGLLLAAVCFGPLAFGAVEPWSRAILTLLLLALFAAHSIDSSRRPQRSLTACQKTLLPAALFLIILCLFQIANARPVASPLHAGPFTASLNASREKLLLLVAYAALLWSAPDILRRKESLKRLAWTLLILGAAIAVAGIIQQAQGNRHIYGFRKVAIGISPFGPYYNKNNGACFLAMCLFAGLGLWINRFETWRGGGLAKSADFLAQQALLSFLLGIIGFALLASTSHGALLSAVVAVVLLGAATPSLLSTRFLRRGLRWLAFGAPAVYFGILLFCPQALGFNKQLLFGPLDISSVTRLSIYRSVKSIFLDFPLWGTGMGSFKTTYLSYQEPLIQGYVRYAHSDWLELLVETGLVGFLAMGVALLAMLVLALRSLAALPTGERRGLGLGFFMALIAFLVHSLFEFNFQIPANAVVFLTLAAALGSRALSPTSSGGDENEASSPLGRFAFPIVSCTLALIISLQTIRPAIAQILLSRARTAELDARPQQLGRALAWFPAPEAHLLLSRTYLELASQNPAARILLSRQALEHGLEALKAYPAAQHAAVTLVAYSLSGLRRVADANQILRRLKPIRNAAAPRRPSWPTLPEFLAGAHEPTFDL